MNGVLPLDKPAGPTSHDMVGRARKALRERRIGHTGTLDPFATGLLLLCIGPATRLAEYLTGMDKSYETVTRLGVRTDTLDPTGEIVAETEAWRDLTEERIRSAFESQAGRRLQVPPVYSAKKVAGRRAYERARAGEAVQPDPVEIVIHELEVTGVELPHVRFRLRCSSGTYVRAVARDAGEDLGVGAHLVTLRRTAVGPFDVADALQPEHLEAPDTVRSALISPLDAVGHLPVVSIGEEERARVGHGQALSPERSPERGLLALAHDDELVAIAEADDRAIRPRKVFT